MLLQHIGHKKLIYSKLNWSSWYLDFIISSWKTYLQKIKWSEIHKLHIHESRLNISYYYLSLFSCFIFIDEVPVNIFFIWFWNLKDLYKELTRSVKSITKIIILYDKYEKRKLLYDYSIAISISLNRR